MTGQSLPAALAGCWEAVQRLPDDDASFDALDPKQRRELHDLGCAIQDRLVGTLARLVAGMALDGAELVDSSGNPAWRPADDPAAAAPARPSPPQPILPE